MNQVKRTAEKAWLERPECCHFQGSSEQMNWKEIPAARLQTVGLGAALLQRLSMFQESREQWQNDPEHTRCLFFPSLCSWQSLFEAGTEVCAVSKREKELKDHSCCNIPSPGVMSWNGDSSGKAPRREQPLTASPHPCRSHHWDSWDFWNAWELNILNLTKASGSEGTVSISSSIWFLVEQ